MSPEQVLTVARQGAALGCKEALLTLGDRPEDRWPEARAWLDEHGYASTLDYVGAMARLDHRRDRTARAPEPRRHDAPTSCGCCAPPPRRWG